ncbi:MAG: DUF3108 domain-containing protein [Saccharospirillaceae bacterium]|nr:DUF3108 domain-containing protein [Saccharospirillaceae bacterium]MCD8531366.1 DUF3108 domain-containing protein [Saccharospirillaceae bacterium]
MISCLFPRLLALTLIVFSPFSFSDAREETGGEHESAPSKNEIISLKPFSARYKTEWKLGWFSVDIEAVRNLRQLPSGHWLLTFEAETSAAALKETSEFSLDQGRIQPLEYSYRATGLFNEADRTLLFSPQLKLVKDLENNKDYPQAWENEIQDNLTYMLQASLDLARIKQQQTDTPSDGKQHSNELNYPVFEKKRVKAFQFRTIAEEPLNTRIGKLKTIKVEQIRQKNGREVLAWFAIDRNYLLVRLVDKEKGKTRYQIDITDLKD